MNHAFRVLAATLFVGVLFVGCATSTTVSFLEESPAISDGPTLFERWDDFAEAARLSAGVQAEGRTVLEIAQPYGNSLLVWHFTDLEPEQPVKVTIEVWVNATANESWFALLGAPGLAPANASGYGRLAGEDGEHYLARWGSDGAGLGTTTEGWAVVTDATMRADAAGNFTVGISTGHWSNNPELVLMYVSSLSVSSQ